MSAARKIATLARLNLTELLGDRAGLVTLIAMPLMLTFLFGTMMGGGERRLTVAFADADRTTYSGQVIGGLDPRSYIVRRVDRGTAERTAGSGEAAAAVIVPAGFGDDVLAGAETRLRVVKDPRSTSAFAIVEAISGRARRIAANAGTIAIVREAYRDAGNSSGIPQTPPAPDAVFAYAERLWSPAPLSVEEIGVTRSKTRGASEQAQGFHQYSLGFTLMFMMFTGLGAAGGFLEEREHGTLARLLTTPTSRATLVAGKLVGIYVTVLFEAAVLVGFGAFVFGVPWGDDPLGVVLVLSTFALATTGLGVMASTVVRTRGQMSAITAVSATALSMLGGAYWPLDIVNPAMRTIAMLTPTGWAMTALTDVVVRYRGPATAVLPSCVLTVMALLFLAVGVSRLEFE